MKTTATTEEVSSPPEEKWHWSQQWRQNTSHARQKPRADWKNDLQTYEESRKSRKQPTPFVGIKPYGKSRFQSNTLEIKTPAMKYFRGLSVVFAALAVFCGVQCLHAQQYSIDWYKISGGGGASTGATYQVTGTIGQPDASGAMSGGNYSLTGGFWSLISVVQTGGAPTLTITHSGNSVTISWPYPSTGWTLRQNSDLTTTSWSPSGGISNDGTNNFITITSPTGNLFFRLSNP